jgi:hypothetical protein
MNFFLYIETKLTNFSEIPTGTKAGYNKTRIHVHI